MSIAPVGVACIRPTRAPSREPQRRAGGSGVAARAPSHAPSRSTTRLSAAPKRRRIASQPIENASSCRKRAPLAQRVAAAPDRLGPDGRRGASAVARARSSRRFTSPTGAT